MVTAKESKKKSVKKVEDTFYYFIREREFVISDLEGCAKSEKTFDLPLFEIANNEKLLDKLKLYYMTGNYAVSYNYDSRAKWFVGYLSAFKKQGERATGQYNKSLTNPVVRLLIEDKKLFEEISKIITLTVGQTVFFSRTEQYWDKPYVMKRHHVYDTRSVILKGVITGIYENQFMALLTDNNGFEKDGQEFVFSKNSLLSNQDYKDLETLGKWKKKS